MIWILTGLAFLLLPGTFLGVWNLLAISREHAASVSPEWIQAHGHAQIFGWIGSFILGIGFYSLSKMGGLGRFAVTRAWIAWALWSAGVAMRWLTNLYAWQWRTLLPLSAALEMAAFVLFFMTAARHRSADGPRATRGKRPVWMIVVMVSTVGFLASLVVNLSITIVNVAQGIGVAVPHALDQRVLPLFTWGFPVIAIWGFSARWLPTFLGLHEPDGRLLLTAVALDVIAVISALAGAFPLATVMAAAGALCAAGALGVLRRSERPPKTAGVHPSFPTFVRIAYLWMLAAAAIAIAAARWDAAGGLWGASRHALTVGFISTMVFSIGQRVLPAFCGMRVLFSPALMFLSLLSLNIGCLVRVVSEVAAYESYIPALWPLLPVSAVIEMAAVTLFAASLILTFLETPPHLRLSSANA
jgi:hypothetical protein